MTELMDVGDRMILISVYILITLLTGTLLYLIVKYLKKKPFGAQFVSDHLCVDLALAVFSGVLYTSLTVIARELHGPFDDVTVEVILALQQLTAANLLTNILSLQFALFGNAFFAAR